MSLVNLPHRARAALAAAATLLLALTSMAAPPVVHAAATTLTIDVSPFVETTFTVNVHLRPSPWDPGTIGTCVSIDLDGGNLICAPIDQLGDTSRTFSDVLPGPHTVHAAWAGSAGFDASSAQAGVTVLGPSAIALSADMTTATDTQAVTVTAVVTAEHRACSGLVTFTDASAGGPLGDVALGDGGVATIVHVFGIGHHALTATYQGDVTCSPSHYPSYVELTVTDDDTSVGASRLGVSPVHFYPVKDGYRDTVAIGGRLAERAHVVISVRNAARTVVRSRDLGTRAPGAWAWAWDGRTAAGRLLPAGTYTVTQRMTDAKGNRRTWTGTVVLSHKVLHWHSAEATKAGDRYGLVVDDGTGWVKAPSPAYTHGVRLRSSEDSAVGVRYGFALRTGVVYSSLTLRVLARSPIGSRGLAGLWNGVSNPGSPKSYDFAWIGPGERWWSRTVPSSLHRSGTLVYAMVWLWGAPARTLDVGAVRLVYRYATLE